MIIGISGKSRSGKSTIARILEERYGFCVVSLADPMKRFCQDVFQFTYAQLWGSSEHRNGIDERYNTSPRRALQELGTQWGRAQYTNLWIDYALTVASELLDTDDKHARVYTPYNGLEHENHSWGEYGFSQPLGVVIPDVRFENELDAIKAAGGKLVRLNRGANALGEMAKHASEMEQETIPDNAFDYVIDGSWVPEENLDNNLDELIVRPMMSALR